jgi:hypothetical protein
LSEVSVATTEYVLSVTVGEGGPVPLTDALDSREAILALASVRAMFEDDAVREEGWVVSEAPQGFKVVRGGVVAVFKLEESTDADTTTIELRGSSARPTPRSKPS